MTENRDIVTEVLEGLADADCVSPEELEYTLYEYVDPEILAKLAALEESAWEFSVRVADHQVTITGDGRLFIDGVLYRTDLPVRR